MKIRTILAAVAVSSLMLAQPAAAATRSYESLPVSGVKAASVERSGAAIAEDEVNAGNKGWMIYVALGLVPLMAGGGDGVAKNPTNVSPG